VEGKVVMLDNPARTVSVDEAKARSKKVPTYKHPVVIKLRSVRLSVILQQSKRNMKVMSARERRERDVFGIPEDQRRFGKHTTHAHTHGTHITNDKHGTHSDTRYTHGTHRFDLFLPLHQMWWQYMGAILKGAQ
jgi:hypothetical protein